MSNRSQDWLDQGRHDLDHARHARDDGDHDWACFAAHQAAEKAVKALILSLNGEGWGHTITKLLQDVHPHTAWDEARFEDLLQAARQLDKHYIPTRYPNGFDAGSPVDYYTRDDADQAIQYAQRIHDAVEQSIS